MLTAFKFIVAINLVVVLSLIALKCWIHYLKKKRLARTEHKLCIAFFHPYCNAGGGGERVLWTALRALQLKYPANDYVVYTGDCDTTSEEILKRAQDRFNISLPRPVNFVFLSKRYLVEDKLYPFFTLLGQSLGSVLLGLEALVKYVPDVYIDSMGYAFTMPLFKYFGNCKVGCYIHYPTISTDMLSQVSNRNVAHNNRRFISRNPLLSKAKLMYYKFFAILYKIVGRTSDVILVNSSWTKGHILDLWQLKDKTFLVYPPCSTDEFCEIEHGYDNSAECRILSIAQFRPEKDHPLQINAFAKFWGTLSEEKRKSCFLVLVGSCRTQEDTDRVDRLRLLCKSLGVERNIFFKLNVSFSDLKSEMSSATFAVHTMWNEHFGIGVVECMAAGLITIAHDSGGPKMDIVVDYNGNPTGFLATDIDSFAETFEKVIKLSASEKLAIQKNAKASVKRFSEEEFCKTFMTSIELLLI